MRAHRSAVLAAAVTLAAFVAPTAVASAAPASASAPTAVSKLLPFGCAATPATHAARCFGAIEVGTAKPNLQTSPTGLGPADIKSAYKLAGLTSGGRTVAIVDAYDDPKAEADLATYRSHYGLPACTTANGCFRKVNQNGAASPLPANDYGWSEEISLDLDAVSATCADCHILLVEASSNANADLYTAVDTAARMGASAISNSYGGNEASTETNDDSHFNHPGIAVTASSGDSGYGVSYPAASPYVTAVGGTTLKTASNARGWNETAWSGAGSGCSSFEPKPAWQHDTGCAKRTVADVSAVADPASGLAVYDTNNSCGTSNFCDFLISVGAVQGLDGWAQVGGTSLSSPIVASVYTLAGNSVTAGSYPYSNPAGLFDVTSGSNGSCSGTYLCTAGPGYDGPTGLGTPNGTTAF